MSDRKSSGESKTQHLEVILEFGHTSTLRDAVDASVPGAATHDWEVWVKNPSNDKIENFLEKVVFTLHDTFKDPKRTVTSPPYKIQEAGYGSFKILIDLYFRAPKGSNLEKATVEYDLALQPFKRPQDEEYLKVSNIRRMERMQFPTRDEDFKRRLLKGGAKLVERHRAREEGGDKKERRDKEKDKKERREGDKYRERDREREKTKEKERPKSATDEMKSKPSTKPKSEFTDLFGTPVIKKSNDKKEEREEKASSSRTGRVGSFREEER